MILTRQELSDLASNGFIRNLKQQPVIDLVSVQLHLDDQIVTYAEFPAEPFTPPKDLKTKTLNLGQQGHVIKPRDCILACSQEIIKMPSNLMGLIQTKGSLARGFLMAHACDGQIDPGYEGKVTFELINLSRFYFRLIPGMPIAQLFVHELRAESEKYDGRYQNSYAPTPMKAS
ncbi:MAG: dCTP deaminase [Verrucomicrobiota bacterium]|jgi:dCTP deaminase